MEIIRNRYLNKLINRKESGLLHIDNLDINVTGSNSKFLFIRSSHKMS